MASSHLLLYAIYNYSTLVNIKGRAIKEHKLYLMNS